MSGIALLGKVAEKLEDRNSWTRGAYERPDGRRCLRGWISELAANSKEVMDADSIIKNMTGRYPEGVNDGWGFVAVQSVLGAILAPDEERGKDTPDTAESSR